MSFYFRDRPKFGDKLRGKSGDELLQEIKQQFDEDSKSFFEPSNRSGRDPFERHSTFSRGFPFDDDGFGRRSDIRTHLDDLAARHPEFADHLLGPPWGDIPFHGTFRNRNRDSGRNNNQGYSDEDARSQASGSSGASAASSHGEADNNQNQHENISSSFEQSGKRGQQIPQYGLRNTVDIGQHHHNMENADRSNRGQRSMSAPPENRQMFNQNLQQQKQQDQPQQAQQQPQRYVSRIDITPQHNQPQQQQQQQPQKPQQQQQQPQKPQQQQQPQSQSNVRHIPIFVEGRDEPVLPRSSDEHSHFRREPSPTQFHTPPHFRREPSPTHFQKPSSFGQHFGGRHRQWSPHFQDSFYPPQSTFEHPSRRQQQTHGFQQPQQQQQYSERQPQKQHYEQPKQQKPQQQSQQQQQQEPPKPKPNVPKDPLERVALVQKEVDSLAEQVKQYNGNSKTDKQYMYLDEMLTRELIKLDDIETEGKDNVRQARKNTIRSIQETISLLESKAQEKSQENREGQEISNKVEESGQPESIDVDHKPEEKVQNKEPIPLPPGPSSPTKKSEGVNEISAEKGEDSSNDQAKNVSQETASQVSNEPMNTNLAEKPEVLPMDAQQCPEQASAINENKSDQVSQKKEQENPVEEKKTENTSEQKIENVPSEEVKAENNPEVKKVENVPSEEMKTDTENTAKVKKESSASDEKKKATVNVSKEKKADGKLSTQEEQQKPAEEKMEVDSEVKQSPKSQKKGKKTKKQTPVSDKPIPLPAPENTDASAK
ncbi:BAG domain-containing protein Samui [Anthophora quadrimaculata]